MEKRVLLKDIAAKVGVSIALVSYVLNNKEGRVGPEMVKKIRKVAADLNYTPNLVAKSLQSGKTHTIGLMVADISNAFFSKIARIIESAAEKFGYTVIFGSTDESADKSKLLINAFLNRQVDGLIIAPVAGTESQLRLLKKNKVPFVLIDRYFSAIKTNSVRVDNYEAAFNATQHLIETGSNNIALVTYEDTGMSHFVERTSGYLAALKKYKRSPNLISVSYQSMEKEVPAAMRRLISKNTVDAVLFATHSLAIEGLKKINRMQVNVPEQLAILSFDENDAFDLFEPRLSFIRQPLAAIAHEAVRLLIDDISRKSDRQTVVELETELVVRESSAVTKHNKDV